MSNLKKGLYYALFFFCIFSFMLLMSILCVCGPKVIPLNSSIGYTFLGISLVLVCVSYFATYKLGCWDLHIKKCGEARDYLYKCFYLKPPDVDEEKKVS